MKNKSYIGTAFIILVFGIYAIPKIVERINNGSVVKGDRLNIEGTVTNAKSDLLTIGKAPKFDLVNQNGKTISSANYKGKVYVLEFFFSTCPSICPIMNKNMKKIQESFSKKSNFEIVSISINPEKDTPTVLKKHAKDIGVNETNWNLLTGDKKEIFEISNKGFNLYAGENSKINGGFEHSGFYALIDKNGQIRCRKDEFNNPIIYYDGLEQKGIIEIKEDIAKLLAE